MIARRNLLQGLALGGLGAALGLGACSRSRSRPRTLPAIGEADPKWGHYPAEALSSQLPEDQRAQSVLEIYLYGGISPWETFYVVDEPDYGKADGQMWWTFHEGDEGIEAVYRKCMGAKAPPLLTNFTKDANGVMVKLGPFLGELRQRTDITDRLRLHVVSHNLNVHEIAVPLALTGYRFGQPRLAGVGSAVQHYFLGRDTQAQEPLAFVIAPYDRRFTSLFRQASASGAHPSSAQPLTLHVTDLQQVVAALHRRSIGPRRGESDALLRRAVDEFSARLRHNGEDVRSRVWEEYEYAASMLGKADTLAAALDSSVIAARTGEACGESSTRSIPAMQLRLAAHLLGRPNSPTRHVTVVDFGLLTDLNVGYDTHVHHILDSGRNLPYFMKELVSVINRPGEKDPSKIDLDRTLVVINTEFGRTPEAVAEHGRNHYPAAYVTAMFGGPIGPEQRGIVGAIDHRAKPKDALAPAETRAAVLAAMGVWPFSGQGYSVSDMRDVKTTAEAAVRVRQKVLGIA